MSARTPEWDVERAIRWLNQCEWGDAYLLALLARDTSHERTQNWLLMVAGMHDMMCGAGYPSAATLADPDPDPDGDWDDVAMWPALSAGRYT